MNCQSQASSYIKTIPVGLHTQMPFICSGSTQRQSLPPQAVEHSCITYIHTYTHTRARIRTADVHASPLVLIRDSWTFTFAFVPTHMPYTQCMDGTRTYSHINTHMPYTNTWPAIHSRKLNQEITRTRLCVCVQSMQLMLKAEGWLPDDWFRATSPQTRLKRLHVFFHLYIHIWGKRWCDTYILFVIFTGCKVWHSP